MYTVACSVKATNQHPLYVGRYTGESMVGLEAGARQFATRELAAEAARTLAAARPDMVFHVCDMIANALEEYTA